MFTYHEIGELDGDSTRDALVLPGQRAGVRYTPEALDELLAHASGFPFFLQVYGRCRADLKDAGDRAVVRDTTTATFEGDGLRSTG